MVTTHLVPRDRSPALCGSGAGIGGYDATPYRWPRNHGVARPAQVLARPSARACNGTCRQHRLCAAVEGAHSRGWRQASRRQGVLLRGNAKLPRVVIAAGWTAPERCTAHRSGGFQSPYR